MKRKCRTTLTLNQLESRLAPAGTTLTWQGDIDNNWGGGTLGTNTNWSSTPLANRLPVDGATLVFPTGAANKTNTNDITGLDLRSIAINDGGYVITGNPITLSGGLTAVTDASATFTPAITLAADQTFAINSFGALLLGLVDLGGRALTIAGNGQTFFSTNATKITGAGGITKAGTGTAIFVTGNDYTGPTLINAGTLQVNSIGGLGATGAGNGTTVASGATFTTIVGGSLAEDLTLSGAGATGQPGAFVLFGTTVSVTLSLTGSVRLGAEATIAGQGNQGEHLTLAGPVGAADDALAVLTANFPDPNDTFAFANTATFTTELAGTTPGAGGHDQLKVIGSVDLGGATLNVVPSFTPAIGAKFVIVDNDGTDAITGTFAGLAEGATVTAGGVNFKISYKGVDGSTGNDVVLTVDSLVEVPVNVILSANAKTATFTDVDGDLVTVKTTKGPFQQTDFRVVEVGVGGQLQLVNLTTHAADFTGSNLTISAKPGPLGGNGFVNVGYVNATGIDLGAVRIGGDLGRIAAGTVGGDLKVSSLKSLDVQSLGMLGTSTQASGGNLVCNLEGALPKLTIKDDWRDASFFVKGSTDGRIGSARIGGSMIASTGFRIVVSAGIGSLSVGGSIRAHAGAFPEILSLGAIGSIRVAGSIEADSSLIQINTFGQLTAPISGTDLAIKSLIVGDSVNGLRLSAGGSFNVFNADASVGSIQVGGDWIASTIVAGTNAGGDGKTGTNDDIKATSPRDNPDIFSSIGSFTVKGQALGTAATNDMFGVVAERIGKAKVGGRTFAFKPGTNEAFFAAPTGPGSGTENPVFDFTIRELGSATPVPAFGGPNLVLSADGKTATYIDVDGDLVTVKRSLGAFVAGDFLIVATASGGGQLQSLSITSSPGDLTITAKPSPTAGNGLVNVGEIVANGIDLGVVRVAGDLALLVAGDIDETRPGIKSLNVHSIGQFGTSTGAIFVLHRIFGPAPKYNVATDVRGAFLEFNGTTAPALGQMVVGGSFVGGTSASSGSIFADRGIGSLKINGSLRSGTGTDSGLINVGSGAIGSMTIGGDIVGSAAVPVVISAFGRPTAPTKGLDVAIKNLSVKGSVDRARILAGGTSNTDASIGTINVGHAWIASTVLAGVKGGADAFEGTADDTKVTGPGTLRDRVDALATISSIVIKGQALGTVAAGDSFGIVAERIVKAKIGTRIFAFKAPTATATNRESFAAAPTGPGPAPDSALSDLFIREITA